MVVTLGVTESEPPEVDLAPVQSVAERLLVALQLVELLAVQVRVDESPGPTKVGVAPRVTIGKGLQVKFVDAAVAEQPLALQACTQAE